MIKYVYMLLFVCIFMLLQIYIYIHILPWYWLTDIQGIMRPFVHTINTIIYMYLIDMIQ